MTKPKAPTARRIPKAKHMPKGPPQLEHDLVAVTLATSDGTSRRCLGAKIGCSRATVERRLTDDPAFLAAAEAGEMVWEGKVRAKLWEYASDDRMTVRGAAVRALQLLAGSLGIGERQTVEHEGVPKVVTVWMPRNGREPDGTGE